MADTRPDNWFIVERKSGSFTILRGRTERSASVWRTGIESFDEARRRAQALTGMLGGRIVRRAAPPTERSEHGTDQPESAA